jgi:hypothetical protein
VFELTVKIGDRMVTDTVTVTVQPGIGAPTKTVSDDVAGGDQDATARRTDSADGTRDAANPPAVNRPPSVVVSDDPVAVTTNHATDLNSGGVSPNSRVFDSDVAVRDQSEADSQWDGSEDLRVLDPTAGASDAERTSRDAERIEQARLSSEFLRSLGDDLNTLPDEQGSVIEVSDLPVMSRNLPKRDVVGEQEATHFRGRDFDQVFVESELPSDGVTLSAAFNIPIPAPADMVGAVDQDTDRNDDARMHNGDGHGKVAATPFAYRDGADEPEVIRDADEPEMVAAGGPQSTGYLAALWGLIRGQLGSSSRTNDAPHVTERRDGDQRNR